MCPFFDLLDEIYGSKVNINPPFIYDSGVESEKPDDVLEEFLIDIDNTQEPSPPSAGTDSEVSDVESMKAKLIFPSGKPRPQKKDAVTMLSESQLQRSEVMKRKVEVDEKRLINENSWKERELDLRDAELKIAEKRIQNEKEIKQLELEKEERVEKFRIEQQFKLQLELAKLQNQK